MASHPALPADQLVTASDLVRHFGAWQDRAARAPLYILHRGRPRFVLTSIETMDALCAAHPLPAPLASAVIDAIPVLDAIGDLVLLADADGMIVASSRAARAYFGALARTGEPVDAITPSAASADLRGAIRHIIDRGIGERLDIASAARAARRLMLTIEPAGRGVVVIAQDAAGDRDGHTAGALDTASLAALVVAGGARTTIDSSGRIEHADAALAAMIDMDPATLLLRPFVTLVADQARAPLDAALAQVLRGQPAAALDSVLLSASGAPVPVRIGLAPISRGGGIAGVAAVILATR
ncbi:PAS domain-containing protein [Sphingomonas glacialis]|uniref:Histidine kinase n=1 Tax=Sphingomonas glacialis TaxID=658225 RepID=A0A502FI12_9SPHN|nr:PAS domain-containing protein [Sphingomonas glacialis]TPG49009.1 histidine kinase [Sphingomonas glacialis]